MTVDESRMTSSKVRELYAGMTAVLERLDEDKARRHVQGKELDVVLNDSRPAHYNLYEETQKCHTNAITRDSEVVAVTICGKAVQDVDDPNFHTLQDHATILVVENPRKEGHVKVEGVTKVHKQ